MAVVVDKAQLPELVHEMTDPRVRRADDLCQRLLADLGRDRLRAAFLAEIGEHEEGPGQALFARVEQLVDQVLLDAAKLADMDGLHLLVKATGMRL